MNDLYSKPDIYENEKVIINPILDYYTLLEKNERKVVYHPLFRKFVSVNNTLFSYPIYLPEKGNLLALDIKSQNLATSFYDKTKDHDRFFSENKILISKTHNYDEKNNRIVSWGYIKSIILEKTVYGNYIDNLINDFNIRPSIYYRYGLYSPYRWFHIRSEHPFYYEATFFYNMGIIFISKEKVLQAKKKILWFNTELPVYEVDSSFVEITKEGRVNVKPLKLHFLADPKSEIIDYSKNYNKKGDYYIGYFISLNNYKTNYYKSEYKGYNTNINIVESLSELVYSPYEIIPFLFSQLIENLRENTFVYKGHLPIKTISRIINRFEKFGPVMDRSLIKSFENKYLSKNKFFEINEKGGKYIAKIANPGIYPYLIYREMFGDSKDKSILKNIDISYLEEIESIVQKENHHNPDLLPFTGINRSLKPRNKQMNSYIRKKFKSLF